MKKVIGFLNKPYLAFFYSVLILGLCVMPSEQLPGDVDDKLAHFVAFSGVSFLWLWVYERYLLVILLSSLFGLAIEFIQGALPEVFHRSYDLLDARADAVGVLIGAMLYFVVNKIVGIKKGS